MEIIDILYTYYSILAGPEEEELRHIVADIKTAGLDITEEVDIQDFLRFRIDKVDSETYHLSKTKLTNQIVSDLELSNYDATSRTTPALTTNKLGNFMLWNFLRTLSLFYFQRKSQLLG